MKTMFIINDITSQIKYMYIYIEFLIDTAVSASY